MHKIKTLVAAFVIAISSCLTAHAITTQLRISFKDGRTLVIDLTATDDEVLPKMTFTPRTVIFEIPPVSADEKPTTYVCEVEDLQAMKPIEVSTEMSSINDIFAADNVVITPVSNNEVRISGTDVADADAVRVYDMNGRMMRAEVVADGDALKLSLADLPSGVYIVNISSTSLKVTKR